MSAAFPIIYDGDLSTPAEVQGGPMISVDPVTRAMTITRNYAVWLGYYVPLLKPGNFTAIPDRTYNDAILIEEIPGQIDGPFFHFQRVFAQIPAARVEPRVVAFSMPGKAAVTLSQLTGKAINWRPYGNGSPYTRSIVASVAFSYAAGDPGPNGLALFPSAPALTRIVYNSLSGPISVDYVGDVYEFGGTRGIYSQSGGVTVLSGAEPLFVRTGTTIPNVLPANWIQEVAIRRFRGVIWEMQIVTVPTA